MNKEKLEKKFIKKYGVSSKELNDLTISKIKDLRIKNQEKFKENKKFKLIRKPIEVILKGATIGTGISGVVNTMFPNIIPVSLTYLTTISNFPDKYKLGILTFLASKPIDLSQGYIILSTGAILGSVLYSGYSLVKITTSNLKILKDKKLIKKMNRFN